MIKLKCNWLLVRPNYLVDEKKENPEKIARDFLRQKGLLNRIGQGNIVN